MIFKLLWVEAMNIANCVLNICLIVPILKKPPYEFLKRKKPNISYFKAFCSKGFIHINGKGNPGKFKARSGEGIFLRHSQQSKTYKVSNKRTKVVKEIIHVTSDENNDGIINSTSF